jgi:hypothetical protein
MGDPPLNLLRELVALPADFASDEAAAKPLREDVLLLKIIAHLPAVPASTALPGHALKVAPANAMVLR